MTSDWRHACDTVVHRQSSDRHDRHQMEGRFAVDGVIIGLKVSDCQGAYTGIARTLGIGRAGVIGYQRASRGPESP